MNISIIDIGTQSLKHYIFEVEGNEKKSLHYKRYSEANLGESETISNEAIERNLKILHECLKLNQTYAVEKLQILGTEILRKASNAKEFTDAVKELSKCDVEIISQDTEALYLYEGFTNIVPKDFIFAAMNIGGGSTEVVIGNKNEMIDSQKIPFGVKFLRKTFTKENKNEIDWQALDVYLAQNISLNHEAKHAFVTGVLDFISTVGPHLGFVFEKNDIPNHPIKIPFEKYISYLNILRSTPLETLKKLYPKDPGFADNFAIGQSVYVAIARKLSAKIIIPSNNDLTDGVIHTLVG